MEQQIKSELFERMPVPKAVATLAVPTVLSMLVTVVYNMVDTYFVGQTGDPNQVAAVSLATPVFLVLMALGNIFGIGGSSLISRVLGEGRAEEVRHISSFCFFGSLITGFVMIEVFLGAMTPIMHLIGTSENTESFARGYLTWIAYGAPIIVVSNAFGNIVRSEGAAKEAMIGMMLGTVINIVLDPLMILSLGMGVPGAAIATVIGNVASCIYYLAYVAGKKSHLSIRMRDFRATGAIVGGVFAIGLPASVNNLLMSTSNIIMNNYLAFYGDIQVAAMGIAMKANMLVVMLQLGISAGIQPLIGYSYGAGNTKRLRAVMRFSMLCALVVGAGLTVVYFFNTKSIVRFFISNDAVIADGVVMLRALMLSGPFLGIMFVLMGTLQAMGKALSSLVLSVSRQGLVFLPVLLLGNYLFGLNGLVYAQPIADIASIFMALLMFRHVMKKEERIKDGSRTQDA